MDGDFRVIGYSDIDLDKTKQLLEEQGLLKVDFTALRAWTWIWILNSEKQLRLRVKPKSYLGRVFALICVLPFIVCIFPFLLISSNVVVLHCIYVNYCHHVEWEKLPDGTYRFLLQ